MTKRYGVGHGLWMRKCFTKGSALYYSLQLEQRRKQFALLLHAARDLKLTLEDEGRIGEPVIATEAVPMDTTGGVRPPSA